MAIAPAIRQLIQEGRLHQAAVRLGEQLRDEPDDQAARTCLVELLSFKGEWDRARRHLEVLVPESPQPAAARLYQRVMEGEIQRQELFQSVDLPREWLQPAATGGARVNGIGYSMVTDTDPRVGSRLELLTANGHLLMPFEQIGEIVFEPPKRLRDLLWRRARVTLAAHHGGRDIGEVMAPVVTPLSFRHSSEDVQLGRATIWENGIPLGQKMWLADEIEIPILEIDTVRFDWGVR